MHEREHDHEKERSKRTTVHQECLRERAGTIDDDRTGLGRRLKDRDSSAHLLSSQKVDRGILG